MLNSVRYKTAKERTEAFWNWYKGFNLPHDAVEAFANWLDLEAPAEKPLPCPFCGGKTVATTNFGGVSFVMCDCGYSSEQGSDKDKVIASHNRVARAAKEKEANS